MSDTAPTPAASATPARTGLSPLARFAFALFAIVVMVVVAWAYGRSGTAPLREEVGSARLRLLLLESRSQVLDAQLSLYGTNFGNAAQHLEYAKPPLLAAAATLKSLGKPELGTKADAALQQVEAARDLAAKLSLDANSRAGEASKLLGEVLQALPR
jgi:hypothetical protein